MSDSESNPHDVPTAAQLVESVREWLERDVMTSTEGRLKFHTRVAVNVLAIVEREMELGAGQSAAHARRLDALGYDSDSELAAALRTRSFTGDAGELRAALMATVVDKLAVANPGYLDAD